MVALSVSFPVRHTYHTSVSFIHVALLCCNAVRIATFGSNMLRFLPGSLYWAAAYWLRSFCRLSLPIMPTGRPFVQRRLLLPACFWPPRPLAFQNLRCTAPFLNKLKKETTWRYDPECQCHHFGHDDGGSILSRNINIYLQLHKVLQRRRPTSAFSPPSEPRISY
jgi:hypothetical protein